MFKYSVPQTAKAWVSLVGALLTVTVPTVASTSENLPAPWPAVIAAIIAVLTALGVYKVPNAPGGPKKASPGPSATGGKYDFPWPK